MIIVYFECILGFNVKENNTYVSLWIFIYWINMAFDAVCT